MFLNLNLGASRHYVLIELKDSVDENNGKHLGPSQNINSTIKFYYSKTIVRMVFLYNGSLHLMSRHSTVHRTLTPSYNFNSRSSYDSHQEIEFVAVSGIQNVI